MNFNETLNLHLNSMKNKDLSSFIGTVKVEDITLIMPNGSFISDQDEFINLHKDWFSDEDWSMEYTLVRTEIGSELAFSLISVDYTDCDETGKPVKMNYYLNLIFRNYNDKWLLIHDQNTIFK